MFENILGQGAAEQLARDIGSSALAPSLLFAGPPASGKASTALELARVLSCEGPGAAWNCPCPSCSRHRLLLHGDLLLLGSRPFYPEIAAAAAALAREPENGAAWVLFVRAARKLLGRFSPVLWEDDPRLGKIAPLIGPLEEALEGVPGGAAGGSAVPNKTVEAVLKGALKLEAEGMGETIPIAQIRRAAYWARLAPSGKRKLLLIENADRMQEGARNSLLKILEEPPERVNIVLSSARPEALLPTVLSRLRPYRFVRRDRETEAAVIRRVFRDPAYAEAGGSGPAAGVQGYLDSFLPVSGETLAGLAAFFAASVAMAALLARRKRGAPGEGEELVLLGKRAAPIAEAAGLGRPRQDIPGMTAAVLGGTANFEPRSLFPRFLKCLLDYAGGGKAAAPPWYYEAWRRRAAEAAEAVGIWNQSPALVLERLATELCRDLVLREV